ncbi:hypothetical protein D3C72_2224690 [compost metagenome]
MALERHAQLSRVPLRQARHVALGQLDLGQQLVGQFQQPAAGGRKRDRHRLALEQGRLVTLFEQTDLVRQGRLGQVEQLRGTHQAAGRTQGTQGAQVADF